MQGHVMVSDGGTVSRLLVSLRLLDGRLSTDPQSCASLATCVVGTANGFVTLVAASLRQERTVSSLYAQHRCTLLKAS